MGHGRSWDESGGALLELFGEAGVTPQDIDVRHDHQPGIITKLEDIRFPARQGGPFVEGRIEVGGELGQHTGHLSEAYLQGMNQIIEVVRQLRGPAQVEGAELGLVDRATARGPDTEGVSQHYR